MLSDALEDTNDGINIGGKNYKEMAYADDIALLTTSVANMNILLDKLYDRASTFGLNINISKTKAVLIGDHDQQTQVKIKSQTVETVKHFDYLTVS